MRLQSKGWLGAAIGLLAAACAATGPPPGADPAPVYDHRVADTNVELYWACSQAQPGVLQVDGVARSPWTEVRFLEVELAAVNAQGRTTDAARTGVRDVVLATGVSSPFRLILSLTGAEARTDLYYQYLRRGERDSLLGGRLGDDFHRNVVRDACSPSQHRR
jgi:hypothetical protein